MRIMTKEIKLYKYQEIKKGTVILNLERLEIKKYINSVSDEKLAKIINKLDLEFYEDGSVYIDEDDK